MTGKEKQQIHELYCKAFTACQRAIKQGDDYIGFRRYKSGFRLIVTWQNCNGKSSARMALGAADWASNVLYRLQDEGFIDLPLDDYFTELHRTGYDANSNPPASD
jgi:hypothetical protein